MTTAARLVQHGGKIILLSRASGPIGPALRRLMDVDDPKSAVAALRGQEAAEDYPIARQLARAMAWADLFVHSALDPQIVEDLSMVALERPEQARRLVAGSRSASFVGRAELTRAEVELGTELLINCGCNRTPAKLTKMPDRGIIIQGFMPAITIASSGASCNTQVDHDLQSCMPRKSVPCRILPRARRDTIVLRGSPRSG